MNDFNTDPAAEIKHLKALEKAKLYEAPPPIIKLKKQWPPTSDLAKLKELKPQVWRPIVDNAESAPWRPGGVPLSDVIRAVLILAALIAVALGVD